MIVRRAAGSFRDPAGYVVHSDDAIYRLLMPAGRESYEQLMASGLYARLTESGLLVPHEEVTQPGVLDRSAWRAIKPKHLPLVTYPYEWSFSAWRDAALLTLRIQRLALQHGMMLKDASAFNIQFEGCRPIFIDTLSIERLKPGPWRAYRQFCQQFLAPLALMAYRDVRLGRLFRVHPEGIPLDLASTLLPSRTWARPGVLLHVHLHALAETRLRSSRATRRTGPAGPGGAKGMRPTHQNEALLDSLERAIRALSWTPAGGWTSYERETPSYSERAMSHKLGIVDAWLSRLRPQQVWDLGANTGRFSRLALKHGAYTVALDEDPGCVEMLYRREREAGEGRLLPLVVDLAAPSPALGWAHEERSALADRGPADLLLALAIVHHLAIGRGIPFAQIAQYFARLGRTLIIEFVPGDDPLAQPLLQRAPDHAAGYTQQAFEDAFARQFRIEESVSITDSMRSLYLMVRP
jgi:hypothetical protein